MLGRKITVLAAALFALLGSVGARANTLNTTTVSVGCTGYTVAATGVNLGQDKYAVEYWFGLQGPTGSPVTYNGSVPVSAADSKGDFNASQADTWNPPVGYGTYMVSWGHATLVDLTTGQNWNTVYINFAPNSFTCQPCCTTQSSNASNFNGTAIPGGSYIWFNSNLQANNVPAIGGTLKFINQTISFTAGGKNYTLPVPNAQITFSTGATCATTTYDAATNTWLTTLPTQGSDEIFLAGLAFPVPAGFGQVTGNVTWNGTFTTTTPGLQAQWKWGAAVFSQFTTSYNSLLIKPTHNGACGAIYNNGDHAGTPEGENASGAPWAKYVIGGARGGGGANTTGSWSGTVSVVPVCPTH